MNELSEVYDSLDRIRLAEQQARKERFSRPLIRALQKKLAAFFLKQGRDLIRRLKVHSAEFGESYFRVREISPSEWEYLTDLMLMSTEPDLTEAFRAAYRASLEGGAKIAISNIPEAGGIGFQTIDEFATTWAEDHAATRISQIGETTRTQVHNLLSHAVRSNFGWERVAADLSSMFEEFSEARAARIARFEIGDAYEAGREIAMQVVHSVGIRIMKRWLNAGDNRVRPEHRQNASDGWIGLDESFSGDGATRPPTDPGCRCATIHMTEESVAKREQPAPIFL